MMNSSTEPYFLKEIVYPLWVTMTGVYFSLATPPPPASIFGRCNVPFPEQLRNYQSHENITVLDNMIIISVSSKLMGLH